MEKKKNENQTEFGRDFNASDENASTTNGLKNGQTGSFLLNNAGCSVLREFANNSGAYDMGEADAGQMLCNGYSGAGRAVYGHETGNQTGNNVFLKGRVDSEIQYSHELYGEGFYEFFIAVPRLSQQFDRLPVTVSERLLEDVDLKFGALLSLNGQFRSYNKLDGERSKLMLTVFARDFVLSSEDANPNIAELSGYICKPPIYRTTPFNREICDLLLAVNRAYNKSDYIPCIAWGRNARFVKTIAVGQRLVVSGRIQSREYNKKTGDDTIEVRTAYELSINKILVENH